MLTMFELIKFHYMTIQINIHYEVVFSLLSYVTYCAILS